MKSIEITATTLQDSIEQLHNELGGLIKKDLKEHYLTIDPANGSGYIRGMRLKGGISFIQFDVN